MKMKTNAILAACATLALGAASPLAAATDYAWSANAADPDNILTNEVHFTPALADIPHADAIKLTASSDMTVRMPSGSDYSAPFGLKFYVNSGHALALDFADATLSQPNTTADAPYAQDGRFNLGLGANALQYAWPGTGKNLNGAFRIENGLMTITNNVGRLDSIDFWRGTWDFLAPNSTTNAGGYLYIAAGWPETGVFNMNFHSGSTLRAPIFFVYASAKTNSINFLGGSHFISAFQMRKHNSAADSYARTRVNVLGSNTCLELGSFSSESTITYQGYRVYVGDGAMLKSGDISSPTNDWHDFVFDGANFTAPKKFSWVNMSVFATNSTFTTAQPLLKTGRMELNNTKWACSSSFIAGHGAGNTVVRMNGGEIEAAEDFIAGYVAGSDATFELLDGDVATKGTVYVGNELRSMGRLRVSGGSFAAKANFVIGNAGAGEVEVSGGRVSTPQTALRVERFRHGHDERA